ncbi:MAG: M1 family metallopeptidase [Ignavibacteria bacterium]|nr:M1 family metallopeptidase [Ignavibacteria bacterium]
MTKLLIYTLLMLVDCSAAVRLQAQGAFQHTVSYYDSPEGIPREHPLDFSRMSLDVSFEPDSGLVKGRVTHVFKVLQERVDSVILDAVNIRVLQATVGTKPTRYRNTDSTIIVFFEPALMWDRTDSIVVIYEASPRKGLYFVGWSDTTATRQRQIWTQGQPRDHRHWIPMYDNLNDKMLTEATITFDSSYSVVSNGIRLATIDNSNGTKTWRYKMMKQHSSYLFMLAIGKYAVTNMVSSSGVPIELYSYPQYPSQIKPTYANMVLAFDFLEYRIGMPYPWSVYRQVPVADFIFGAMENTTATIFGDFYLTDSRAALDRSYLSVNVHELTHQWFGDLVTARSAKDHWLQESFATFYPLLFTETLQGKDAYQWSLRGMQNAALSAGEADRLPVAHPKAGGSRVYQKGAAVLDMMRYAFGDDALRRVILHYLKHNAFSNVETNDLYLSFQDTLGLSPKWFFDQWIYHGGEPHYSVSYKSSKISSGGRLRDVTLVDVEQIHPTDAFTGFFEMPVIIEVHYAGGKKDSVKAWVKGERTVVEIPNTEGKTPLFVLFDAGSRILKRLTFKRTAAELEAQARKAPYMIDRYDALMALLEDSSQVQSALSVALDAMSAEPYYAMRSASIDVARQAMRREPDLAWKIFERGLADSNSQVRKAALSAMDTVPERLRAKLIQLLADSSFFVIQRSLTMLCSSFPSESVIFANQVRAVKSPEAFVEITALEMKAIQGDLPAIDSIAEYGSNRHEFGARRNAFNALKRLGILTETAAINLIDASQNPNERLVAAAMDTIEYLSEQTRWKELLRRVVLRGNVVGNAIKLERLIR